MRVGARRLRALALGDLPAVREFVQNDSALRLAEARRDAREDLASLDGAGAWLVTMADADYPGGLLDLLTAPAFLCVRGVIPLGGIAIVGTRVPSDEAQMFAYAFARALGQSIVSGLALGIDAAAHRGALDSHLPQIAYVGTGIARTYPPEHADLAASIVANGGAIASERLPNDDISRWSLVQRDRLQAAHAQAVVLVESEADGGAMHTMHYARELGRATYVVSSVAEGNRAERERGARILPSDPEAAAAIVLRDFSYLPSKRGHGRETLSNRFR